MIERGEIIDVNLSPTKGGEKNKKRPCVVLVGSGHPWNLITVVPITEDNGRRSDLFVSIPFPNPDTGLEKQSTVDCFQIRCLDEVRCEGKRGKVSEEVLDEILSTLSKVLQIESKHTYF